MLHHMSEHIRVESTDSSMIIHDFVFALSSCTNLQATKTLHIPALFRD